MSMVVNILVGVIAALHAYFLVLEMVLWDTPYGRQTFAMSPEQSAATKTLALNQGLYNGFLSAGLIWSLLDPHDHAFELKIFFLGCVTVAGIVGAMTVSRKIFFVQALPAIVALAILHIR